MSQQLRAKYSTVADWDAVYRAGTPPWDAGKPHAELSRVLDEYQLRPQTVLEVGCGTGADAILMARRHFDVTAVDCSPIAVERARLRAEQHDALLHFVLADAFEFVPKTGQFDLVYDAGLYHSVREAQLEQYLDMLWRVTRPGSYFLCLAGATSDAEDDGPPQGGEEQIRNELGRLFEFVHLRPTRLEGADPNRHGAAWSCLMRR